MKLFVLILFTLNLCASGFAQNEGDKTGTSLRGYLQTAQVEGIISMKQVVKLQELAIRLGLPIDDVAPGKLPKDVPAIKPGVFMKLYNRLTLLNVLYFGGGLLVMGAATLFMTLAWEKLSGITLFLIIGSTAAAAGSAGVMLWSNEEYEMAGGM